MKREYKVYSENWQEVKVFTDLEVAKTYRLNKYGYAGYIIEHVDGDEVANHS
uniref:Uncharacterized protein n=1 Tax=viral metagenome TaxID=1070528 RepID=A0A6H1ZW61_9ZZZZ